MNRQQFISYMDIPDKLSGDDGVLLAEIVKNFPYFQTAHLLYTKSLHNQHSIHYNNQLKITAAYATSRKRLHELITKKAIVDTNNEFVKAENNIIKNLVKEEIIPPVVPEITSTFAETVVEKTITEAASPVEKTITVINVEIAEPIVSEIIIAPVEAIAEKTTSETIVFNKIETPEASIQTEAIPPVEETVAAINKEVTAPIVSEIKEALVEVVTEKTIQETTEFYAKQEVIPPVEEIITTISNDALEPIVSKIKEVSAETDSDKQTHEVPIAIKVETPVIKPIPALILTEITQALKEAIVEKTETPLVTIVETPKSPIKTEIEEDVHSTIEAPDKAIEELVKNYLHEAAIAAVEIDLVNTPLTAEEKNAPVIVQETDFVLNTPKTIQKTDSTLHIQEEELEEGDFDQQEAHTFTEWLKHIPNTSKAEDPEKTKIIKEKQTAELTGLKKSKNELIDKFLKEEPRIRPKAEFFNPANVAKQSVADDITFVSETLAKIYLLQENYNKAIEAYENLRLKYPEKRLYFATQIKKIRKLINPNN